MTYGVFMAATKLKHYFEEHPMKVVCEAPISKIIGSKDAMGGSSNGHPTITLRTHLQKKRCHKIAGFGGYPDRLG
jgi:hypothetical protein